MPNLINGAIMTTYDNNTATGIAYKGTPFTHWLRWFFLLTIISVAFLYASIIPKDPVHAQTLVGNGMYVIIAVVALLCLILSFMEARYISKEMKAADKQVKILEVVDDFDSFLHKAEPSIFKTHIENLYKISKMHNEINQDNLIEIIHSRMLSRNQTIELFSNILITLGLIGTIVGLVFMMNSLVLIMKSSNASSNLLADLAGQGGPFAGLGVAFYTTLLGAVLGGVLLRILTSVVDISISRYIAHIAELTEVYVLPHMRSFSMQAVDNHRPINESSL